ncbi:hypothetical protein BZG36_02827 [Bifiguratus adelaidae]|uniref:Vacuolar protein sorting-associated protein 41 n=1 Tax=Bifiguratus adelaidae TaxID=1938954 RepID=A0A261Y0G8_9FUNG|nr:hypothetical protein BZG36_02827 [Bifiguratus adelaidae]
MLVGRVLVNHLYGDETTVLNYRRPVKAVAIAPNYAHHSTKNVVSGGMAEQLIMNEKSRWGGLGGLTATHKDTILHLNEGPIYAIRWRKNLIAWSNDLGVKIYDTATGQRITYVNRPPGSPRPDLYKCRLFWKNDTTLMIGWADMVKIAVVRERQKSEQQPGLPSQYVEIISMYQTDFMISGIASFNEDVLLLAYVLEDELQTLADESEPPPEERQRRREALRPEIRIISHDNEELSNDVLAVNGYHLYQANDYMLDHLEAENHFYIMSPKDIVLARPRDINDHLQWLVEHERYEEALKTINENTSDAIDPKFNVKDIGHRYLEWLIAEDDWEKCGAMCQKLLPNDQEQWEAWVFRFLECKHIQASGSHGAAIAPYVPLQEPQLSSTVYEVILAWLLNNDPKELLITLRTWPSTLYNIQSVIIAIKDKLRDKQEETLLECLAELYTYDGQPAKAIEYYLLLHKPNAFDLIARYNLFSEVKDKVMLLMDFDQELMRREEEAWAKSENGPAERERLREEVGNRASDMPAVQMLVQHTDAIKPRTVVQQLKSKRKYLHTYLDALFERDPQLGIEFHDLQVELYAEFDYPKLLDFLRASNYINLEKAYKACEKRDLVPEMVFILGRMGNNREALMLIIERLQDVQRAIEFAKEQNDDDLWEDLLTYSMDKPSFIKALLENVGVDIDPIRLIKRIPQGLAIPDLKPALMKILYDYRLQLSLRQGTQKILVSDSVELADRMWQTQRHGVAFRDQACPICDLDTGMEQTIIVFFCGHAYHEDCLFKDAVPLSLDQQLTQTTLQAKLDHAAILRSARTMKCPRCEEQTREVNFKAGGFVRNKRIKAPHAEPLPQKETDDIVPMVPLTL